MCGEEGHWEEDCPQADVDMPQAKRRVTFARPPVGTGVSQVWGVETWTVSPSTDSAEARLKTCTSQEIQESTNLMGVTLTMPEGHAILDCGAALDCIGEVAAARTAQAITASGETRRPAVMDKIQRFKFGGDGAPVEASFAVTLPVQIGDAKTWIEAFVVPGSALHLISRRWLSQHRCVVNFDPNNLCLESPEFGSVPLVLHSSGHLLLSFVSPSNPLDQYTVMIDYQNSPSSVVNNFQKCGEQIMDSSRNQVVCKRAEPDEKRAGNSTLVRRRSDHPAEFAVHLDDPNEEITEQWQDGLHKWYIRRDDQCSVKPNRISRDVSEMRSRQSLCPCLKRRSVSVSTNSKVSTPREPREPVAVLPQKPSVVAWFQRCFRLPHLFGLPSPRKVDSSDRTYISGISRIATNGSGVVDKIAKTARVTCLYVLMVGATSCLDQVVHAFPVADASPISCPCVEIFHVDPRDNVEQRVRQNNLMNRTDVVQLSCRVVRTRTQMSGAVEARHATYDRINLTKSQTERGGEQDWKSLGDPPLWR